VKLVAPLRKMYHATKKQKYKLLLAKFQQPLNTWQFLKGNLEAILRVLHDRNKTMSIMYKMK
jgi:hypothetical protein